MLEQEIEKTFLKNFGFTTVVIIRKKDDIQKLVDAKPFQSTKASDNSVPNITFLKSKPQKKTFSSYPVSGKGYTILRILDGAVCSVVDLSDGTTPNLMKVLEDAFGKNITTRSWKTVQKVLAKQN
jgi:uncharacterized protein (DUF1697 family)